MPLRCSPALERGWTDLPERGMTPALVIEHLDVVEQRHLCVAVAQKPAFTSGLKNCIDRGPKVDAAAPAAVGAGPGGPGRETAPPLAGGVVPVVVSAVADRGTAPGVAKFLRKPVASDVLRAAVAEYCPPPH